MKSKLVIICITLSIISFSQSKGLRVGDKIPACYNSECSEDHFIDNIEYFKKENGFVLLFISTDKCDYTKSILKNLHEVEKILEESKVKLILLSVNQNKKNYFEFVKNHRELHFIDKDKYMTKMLNVTKYPQVFLFNKNNILLYKGSVDDRFFNKNQKINREYLKDAVFNINKKIAISETEVIGKELPLD